MKNQLLCPLYSSGAIVSYDERKMILTINGFEFSSKYSVSGEVFRFSRSSTWQMEKDLRERNVTQCFGSKKHFLKTRHHTFFHS